MDFLKLATTLKVLRILAIFLPKLGLLLKRNRVILSNSCFVFVQILMFLIKLRITIITGQLNLIRCYTYAKREHNNFSLSLT